MSVVVFGVSARVHGLIRRCAGHELPQSIDVAILAVLVAHTDELEGRQTKKNEAKRWVGSKDFLHDFRLALDVVERVVQTLERRCPDFCRDLRSAEGRLLEHVEACQKALLEEPENEGELPDWARFNFRRVSKLAKAKV